MTSKRERTQQKLWSVAERLFMERGLAGVTLQDIAGEMQMHHVSLYYYIPNGKEQLYVEVMERAFHKHRDGLTDAITRGGDDFRTQMHAVATWFATQQPLDLGRIVRSDLPLLDTASAEHVIAQSLECLRLPIANALRGAAGRGQVVVADVDFAAMSLIALLQSVHNIPVTFIASRDHLIQLAISAADSLLDGWFKR